MYIHPGLSSRDELLNQVTRFIVPRLEPVESRLLPLFLDHLSTKHHIIDHYTWRRFHQRTDSLCLRPHDTTRTLLFGLPSRNMVQLLKILFVALSLSPVSYSGALPALVGGTKSDGILRPRQTSSSCQSMSVRKEWRKLTYEEQADYIKSVKCLARLPSKLLGPSYRRWDDFQYVHCEKRHETHNRMLFLAWHRYFIWMYEKALKDECGLLGTLPYWDWTLDSFNITLSPLWSSDPVVGFGSNGTLFGDDPDGLESGIVNDGAFAKFPVYHPGRMMLQRNFHLAPEFLAPGYYLGSQWYNPNNIQIILSQPNVSAFITRLEGNYIIDGARLPGPHTIIHALLGGDMPKLAYSANDPIFYPHHAQVDKLWLTWQLADWKNRAYQYLPAGKFSASLDDPLDYLGLSPNGVKARDVMNTFVPPFCYHYE